MKQATIKILLLTLFIALSFAATRRAAASDLYWTEILPQRLQASDADGGNVDEIIPSGIGIPLHTDVDPAGEKIYWSELGAIRRADLDGSNVESIFSTPSGSPNGLALDTAAGKVYWTLPSENKIQRSNLDGSGMEDVPVAAAGPIAVAVDAIAGKLYWSEASDASNNAKIRRSNLDGTGLQLLKTLASDVNANGIALDLTNQMLYWGESTAVDTGLLWRSSLDGSGASAIISTGLVEVEEIALDVAGGKVYFTQPDEAEIQRANLDGSSIEPVITTGAIGASFPYGLAFLTPSNTCDFTGDTNCNLADINLMFAQGDLVAGVAVGAGNQFDLISDLTLDNLDVTEWLSRAATKNSFPTPYRRGDTELDRDVDITDFNALAVNFAATPVVPAPTFDEGNFDGDSDSDITDFNSLAVNFAASGYSGQSQSVPEPATVALCGLGCMLLLWTLSRRKTGL